MTSPEGQKDRPVQHLLARGTWPEARYVASALRTETVGGALLLGAAVIAVPLLLTAFQVPPASQPTIDQTFGTLEGRRVEAAQNDIVSGLLKLVYDGDGEMLRDVGRNSDVVVVLDDLSGCE